MQALLQQLPVFSSLSLVLATIGSASVVMGVFEEFPGTSLWAHGVAGALLLASVAHLFMARQWQSAPLRMLVRIAALLLWSSTLWIVHRALIHTGGQGILLLCGFLGWLVLANSMRCSLPVFLLSLAMEAGLTLRGLQSPSTFLLNLLFFCLTVAAVLVARRHFPFSPPQTVPQPNVSSLSPGTSPAVSASSFARPDSNAAFPILAGQDQSLTVDFGKSTSLLLESLRQALDLTTIAVLWPAPGNALTLQAVASTRQDLLPGPFTAGRGITGALLKDTGEIAVAGIRPEFPGLPYYGSLQGVGSILGLRQEIRDGQQSEKSETRYAMLFCDRKRTDSWKDEDREALRIAFQKVASDRNFEDIIVRTAGEREAVFRVCNCLRKLNGALGLTSVYAATAEAVREIAPIDFLAVSLLEGTKHRVAHIEGKNAEDFLDKAFPAADGLVGQALKVRHWLPAGASYPEAAPIFSENTRFQGLNSLLILPLIQEGGAPIGALTVAAEGKGVFTAARRELFELLAAQVAVKLDLAQAHEQITRLATTDGLTGLANHRTFQHAFNIMIERTIRNQCPLCLILCDIDHFKKVNDTYGHPFGDRVLMEVSRILSGQVRKVDLAARYGGEEFAVLLEAADEKGGKMLAERIRHRVEQLVIHHDREQVRVTMSLGLAFCPRDGEEKSELIERADQALYRAKSSGRNRTVTWTEVAETG